MQTLATHFTTIIATLQAAIAVVAARNNARIPLLLAVWFRVNRMAKRFERLFARWQAGTLPKPRASRAGQTRSGQPRPKSPFPTSRAWLIATTRETAAAHGQLAFFLARPDLADFPAAVPRAARILRPLCFMLSTDLTLPGDPPPPPPRPYQPPVEPPQFRAPKPARRPRPTLSRRTGTPDRPPPSTLFCFSHR